MSTPVSVRPGSPGRPRQTATAPGTVAREFSWRRLGSMVDAGTPERRVSSIMIALGVFMTTLMVLVAGVIIGSYHERLAIDDARVPTSHATVPDPVTTGPRWRILADDVGDQWVDVVVIVPGPGAVLPPGLSRWPAPGQTVLAPALVGTPAARVIQERYGPAASSVIGPDGVVSATERLVYWRPPDAEAPAVTGYPLTRMGLPWQPHVTDSGTIGGAGRQRGITQALFGYAVAIGLPALVLLLVSARIGSDLRDRRVQILTILGAGPREITAMLWGSMRRPILTGGAGAFLVLAVLCLLDTPIPASGFVLPARDVRAGLLGTIPLGMAGWAASATIILVLNRARRHRGTRPRALARPDRPWKLLALPLACILYIQTLIATLSWEDSTPRILIIYGGTLLVALSIPSFIGAATSLAARTMARLGRSIGAPALIVAGRQLLHDPRAVRRLASGLALVIVLMAQVLVISTFTDSTVRNALALREVLGRSVMSVTANIDTPQQRQALDQALDGRGGLIAIHPRARNGATLPSVITADCPALTALSLPCADGPVDPAAMTRDPRVRVLIDGDRPTPATITIGNPLDHIEGNDILAIVSLDGADLPVEQIRHDLAHTMVPPPEIDAFGHEWLVGLQESRDQASWNTVGAGAATLMVALAITGAVLGDGSLLARRTGVLAMWGARPRFAIALTTARVLVPLLAATVIGGITALIVTAPLIMPPLNARLPDTYFIATLALPVVASLAVTALGLRAQIHELDHWQPRRTDDGANDRPHSAAVTNEN